MTTSPTGPTPPSDQPANRSRAGIGRWLLPSVTFLVGLALGALLLWATRPGAEETGAGAAPTTAGPTTTPSQAPPAQGGLTPTPAPSDATVTVPASCLQLAADVRRATGLLDQVAAAARDVDAARLADLVRQMGQVRSVLEAEADACRAAAAEVSVSLPPNLGTTS